MSNLSSVCFDTVLDQIQSCNIEEAEHVDYHPGDDAPANIWRQYESCHQGVNPQHDLYPDHGTQRSNIGAINFSLSFSFVTQVELWRADKRAACTE